MFTCFGLVPLFVVDLFVCLFCYCSLPVTALPNYVITLLYLPLVRLFVFVLFFEFVDVFVLRLGRGVVVVLLFFGSFVLPCLFNLVFLGDLGHSFVDLRSVSSRGVFLAGYGVPLAVRVAYVFVANVRVGCGKICMLFNAWRWR